MQLISRATDKYRLPLGGTYLSVLNFIGFLLGFSLHKGDKNDMLKKHPRHISTFSAVLEQLLMNYKYKVEFRVSEAFHGFP
jgi:hypothetical protein